MKFVELQPVTMHLPSLAQPSGRHTDELALAVQLGTQTPAPEPEPSCPLVLHT